MKKLIDKSFLNIYQIIVHEIYYFLNSILIKLFVSKAGVKKGEFKIEHLVSFLDKAKPIIIEIGAHDGSTTAAFISLFPKSTVYAFEPGRSAIAQFKKRKFLGNVELHELALSNKDYSEIEFYESYGKRIKNNNQQDYNLSSSILTPKFHRILNPWIKFLDPYTVSCMCLDSFIKKKNINKIDFIWMDAQGAESLIIEGAKKALQMTRYLYFEYSFIKLYRKQGSLRKILEELKEFEIVEIFRNDILLRNTFCD